MPSPHNARRYVLLDRDGTLIVERHYLSDPAQVELLPGAVEGLRGLQQLGFGLAVVTNQSGLGRGYFTRARLDEIHARMLTLLGEQGITFEGIFVCPHTPEDNCHCRKPNPGLVQEAAAKLGFDPRQAFVIGDKACDVDLGRNVGAKSILVRTGYGAKEEALKATTPDYTVDNLAAAAEVIAKEIAASPVARR